MTTIDLSQERGELDEIAQTFERIVSAINKIESNTNMIRSLGTRSTMEVRADGQRMIMNELERLLVSSRRQLRAVKPDLDQVSHEIDVPGSTLGQVRQNLLQTHTRHFQQAVNEFQIVSEAFRESLRRRIRRQAEIVKPDITEEQIQTLILEPNPGKIFQLAGADPRTIDATIDIELDRDGMAKIEAGVMEIHELFQDMAILVASQQEQLDVIEQNVSDTAQYTAAGGQNLIEAREYQRSSRKKQLCILLFVAVIAVVIILVVVMGYFRR